MFESSLKLPIAIFLLVMLTTCDENIIEPKLEPGRRDYVWEVDTLAKVAQFNSYSELYVQDEMKMWVGGDDWESDKNLLEFNGQNWSPLKTIPYDTRVWALDGYNVHNLWIGGVGRTWKYNSSTFEEFEVYPILDGGQINLMDIGYNSFNDMYMVGGYWSESDSLYYSTIQKYDGNTWEFLELGTNQGLLLNVEANENDRNELILLCVVQEIGKPALYKILNYKNGIFREIFNNQDNYASIPSINKIREEMYIGFKSKIYTTEGGALTEVLNFNHLNRFAENFYGRSLTDMIFAMEGGIAHYNGENSEIILSIDKNFYIVDVELTESEIYVLYYTHPEFKFFVARGQLMK